MAGESRIVEIKGAKSVRSRDDAAIQSYSGEKEVSDGEDTGKAIENEDVVPERNGNE